MNVRENIARIHERIRQAAHRSRRDPTEIRLMAVSKGCSLKSIEEAYEAGQRLYGENRVQEAAAKLPFFQNSGCEWHLIGHLQSNKVRRAIELFHSIDSLDSEKILRKVSAVASELQRRLPIFLEVNIGEEPQKTGVLPAQLKSLVAAADSLASSIELMGLMVIPPFFDQPEQSRPYFRATRLLLDEINRHRATPLTQLSMGMTHDFEVAIEEGTTIIRLGTAIFGPRA